MRVFILLIHCIINFLRNRLDREGAMWRSLRAHLHSFIKLPFFQYSFQHLHQASDEIDRILLEMSEARQNLGGLLEEADSEEQVGPTLPSQYARSLY